MNSRLRLAAVVASLGLLASACGSSSSSGTVSGGVDSGAAQAASDALAKMAGQVYSN